MNSATQKAVRAILATDDTISSDQRDSALAILNGKVTDKAPLPLLLTQKQAGQLLGISRFTIRKMTREGQLHPVRVHDRRYYRTAELEALASGR